MASRKKARKYRGPSRPIDPRYRPGQPVRRGPDTFGMVLIGLSSAFVVLVVIFIALTQRSTTPTASSSSDPNALATQQAQAFQTQAATADRIAPQEAITLHASGNAKFVDVRPTDQYNQEHIVGATNIVYTDTARLAAELPREGQVILYCQ
jgi:hypothetical protein